MNIFFWLLTTKIQSCQKSEAKFSVEQLYKQFLFLSIQKWKYASNFGNLYLKHVWNSNLKVLSPLEYAQKLCFMYELSTHSTTHAPFRALEYFKNDITIFCFKLSSYVLEIELQIKPAAPFSDLSWESSQLYVELVCTMG